MVSYAAVASACEKRRRWEARGSIAGIGIGLRVGGGQRRLSLSATLENAEWERASTCSGGVPARTGSGGRSGHCC